MADQHFNSLYKIDKSSLSVIDTMLSKNDFMNLQIAYPIFMIEVKAVVGNSIDLEKTIRLMDIVQESNNIEHLKFLISQKYNYNQIVEVLQECITILQNPVHVPYGFFNLSRALSMILFKSFDNYYEGLKR